MGRNTFKDGGPTESRGGRCALLPSGATRTASGRPKSGGTPGRPGAGDGRMGPRGQNRFGGRWAALSLNQTKGSVEKREKQLRDGSTGVHDGSTDGSISRGPIKLLANSGDPSKTAHGSIWVHDGSIGVHDHSPLFVDPSDAPAPFASSRGGLRRTPWGEATPKTTLPQRLRSAAARLPA
jgi:hypothetical protein